MSLRPQHVFRGLILLLVLGLVAANFLGRKRSASQPVPNVSATSRAPAPPPGPLVDIDGPRLLEQVRRSKAKGVLVNAWASWCGPCKQEMPILIDLSRKLGPSSIELVFVSVDEPDARIETLNLLQQYGAPLPSYVVEGSLDAFKAALNPRWPGMIPATFLFEPSGKLRYFWGGPVFENEILPLLQRFLDGEDVDGEANFALSRGRIDRSP